jgi:hypothetical protein
MAEYLLDCECRTVTKDKEKETVEKEQSLLLCGIKKEIRRVRYLF